MVPVFFVHMDCRSCVKVTKIGQVEKQIHVNSVAENFWYVCLFGRATAGLS
jgi:hypothetical protein